MSKSLLERTRFKTKIKLELIPYPNMYIFKRYIFLIDTAKATIKSYDTKQESKHII